MRKLLKIATVMTFAVPVVSSIFSFAKELRRTDSLATLGIVTQVEGSAFVVRSDSESFTARVGSGVLQNDRIWVDQDSLVRMTDTLGARVTVAGPAVVELRRDGKVHVLRGSVKIRAADQKMAHFETALINGATTGEAALWVSNELSQVLGLAGEVKAWHPKLEKAQVLLAPGFYTESSLSMRHLQPNRPARVGDTRFQAFLARFEKSIEDKAHFEQKAPTRTLASHVEIKGDQFASVRGSREVADVLEPKSEESTARLAAHYAGKDVDDVEAAPLATPGRLVDAYGRPVRSLGKRAQANAGPWVEVVGHAKGASASDQKDLLKKIKKFISH